MSLFGNQWRVRAKRIQRGTFKNWFGELLICKSRKRTHLSLRHLHRCNKNLYPFIKSQQEKFFAEGPLPVKSLIDRSFFPNINLFLDVDNKLKKKLKYPIYLYGEMFTVTCVKMQSTILNTPISEIKKMNILLWWQR